jgi:hypothetical protein
MEKFHDLPIGVLENEHVRLEYLTTAGPRIVGLSYRGSPNMLADVHDLAWDTPNGAYHPYGGHRLWISPESPEKTYIPDGTGLQMQQFPNGVELTGVKEIGSGVRKSMRIELATGQPGFRLTHSIRNENPDPIRIAPWSITMFRLGGWVLLPQPAGNADPYGLLPNRFLALWPYTRLNDPRLIWRDDFILLHATSDLPPAKLGYAGTAGWLAYWLDGILFRKSFDIQAGAVYPDGGCNTESYCNNQDVELESLGPLETLAPGASSHLSETWELKAGLDVPFIPMEIRDLILNI